MADPRVLVINKYTIDISGGRFSAIKRVDLPKLVKLSAKHSDNFMHYAHLGTWVFCPNLSVLSSFLDIYRGRFRSIDGRSLKVN